MSSAREMQAQSAPGVSERIFLFLRLIVISKTVEVLRRKKPELSFPFILFRLPLSFHRKARGAKMGNGMRKTEENAQEQILTSLEM